MATNVLRPVSLSIRASRPCSIVSGSFLLLSSGAGLRAFRKDESRFIVTLTGFRYGFAFLMLMIGVAQRTQTQKQDLHV